MHSDLEEGEIRDDVFDNDEVDVSHPIKWDTTYLSTKNNHSILSGTLRKIPLEKESKLSLTSHPEDRFPTQKRQNKKNINTYTDIMGPISKADRRKRKLHHVNTSEIYNGNYASERRPRIHSAISDCSCSSCEIALKTCMKIKKDHQVKKTNQNYSHKNYHHSQKYQKNKKMKSKNASLSDHKKGYHECFTKSVTEKNYNVFIQKERENLSILKNTTDVIKPGSIGEILLTRKKRPLEITILDSEQASSSKIKKLVLSDDEDLLMLRKQALESRNISSNENKSNCSSENSAKNISSLVKDQISSENVSVEVHNEVVDMEISISDEETNAKEKKEFPIEWAYMMPPPADNKNDSNIHAINQWCYNQNMYVQAMQSTNEIKPSNCSNVQSLESIQPLNKFDGNNGSIPNNNPDHLFPDAAAFSDANLIGGHAKQYHDFMAKFCREQSTMPISNHRVLAEVPIAEQIVQKNLIEIPLTPFIPESRANLPTPETATSGATTPEVQVSDEYDEDLLLATLLIDQEKRAQKRQDKKIICTAKHRQSPKKRSKKLANVKRGNSNSSSHMKVTEDAENGQSRQSKSIKYGNYKFPEVKPIIISLQNDSDSESEHLSNGCDTNGNIGQFIRNIRNSNLSNTTECQVAMKAEVNTPEAMVYLSKSKQEYYRMLRERLNSKITNKTQLFKKSLQSRQSKMITNKSPSKNMPTKIKRKSCKFNFSMNKSSDPELPVKENLIVQESLNPSPRNSTIAACLSSVKETVQCSLQLPKVTAAAITNEESILTKPTQNLEEILKTDISPKSVASQTSHNCNPDITLNNEDDDLALRKILLLDLKSKTFVDNIKHHSIVESTDTPDTQISKVSDQVTHLSGLESNEIFSIKFISSMLESLGDNQHVEELKRNPINNMIDDNMTIAESTLANEVVDKPSSEGPIAEIAVCQMETVKEKCNQPLVDIHIKKENIEPPPQQNINMEKVTIQQKPDKLEHSITRNTSNITIKLEKVPLKLHEKTESILQRKLATPEPFITSNVAEPHIKKDKSSTPFVQDKNRTEEDKLLKHIEQEVVKERNKVFSSQQKLSDDIKKSERYFAETKLISVLISSLKAQLQQAEKNYSNKVLSATSNIGKLLEKKSQLKKHINRSKELQHMGEKLGKQIIGPNYTFPPPPSNYQADYTTIESGLNQLKKRVSKLAHCQTPRTTPQSLVGLEPKKDCVSNVMKNAAPKSVPPIINKNMLKIVKGSGEIEPSGKMTADKVEKHPTNSSHTFTSLNPESSSDMDVLCPHDLLGRCNDESCVYIHLQSPTDNSAISQPPLPHSYPETPAVDCVNIARVPLPSCDINDVDKPTYPIETLPQISISSKRELTAVPLMRTLKSESLCHVSTPPLVNSTQHCEDPPTLSQLSPLDNHECKPRIQGDRGLIQLKRVAVHIKRLDDRVICSHSKLNESTANCIKSRLRNRQPSI